MNRPQVALHPSQNETVNVSDADTIQFSAPNRIIQHYGRTRIENSPSDFVKGTKNVARYSVQDLHLRRRTSLQRHRRRIGSRVHTRIGDLADARHDDFGALFDPVRSWDRGWHSEHRKHHQAGLLVESISDRAVTRLPGPIWTLMKILLYVTGAGSAATTVLNLHALRLVRPYADVKVVLTRTALRFVTPDACALHCETVVIDDWSEVHMAEHVDLTVWPDCVIVYPATLNFVTRFAGGASDTPMMLALQCTQAPIHIAPSLPPGGAESRAFATSAHTLTSDPRVRLQPTEMAHSHALNAPSTGGIISFMDVLESVPEATSAWGK